MKCKNPSCLMDATRVLQIKKGSPSDFVSLACDNLGVTPAEAQADEKVRQKVVFASRILAYEKREDLVVCTNCIDWAVGEIKKPYTDAEWRQSRYAIQVMPFMVGPAH